MKAIIPRDLLLYDQGVKLLRRYVDGSVVKAIIPRDLLLYDQDVKNFKFWIWVRLWQCCRKTFMVHQTFIWWALYILFKFMKFLIRHLGLAIGNVHDVHAKGQSQRSKIKVTEVETQFSCLRTVTPVWIHIWWWNDVQGLMWHRCALLFFKVICQISRSRRTKHSQFWPNLGISGL